MHTNQQPCSGLHLDGKIHEPGGWCHCRVRTLPWLLLICPLGKLDHGIRFQISGEEMICGAKCPVYYGRELGQQALDGSNLMGRAAWYEG